MGRKIPEGVREYSIQVPAALGDKATILARLTFRSRNQYIRDALSFLVAKDLQDSQMKRKVNKELARTNGDN